MDILEKALLTLDLGRDKVRNFVTESIIALGDWAGSYVLVPSLEDTLSEKIGGGPHGYGDPRDAKIREVEVYLFPRMIWKKVRFEKCFPAVENFYRCASMMAMEEPNRCQVEQKAMFDCNAFYYSVDGVERVEQECIIEYLQLRSKFRETGSEDDLWKMQMLMLEPSYDAYYQAYKRGASKEELEKLQPQVPVDKGILVSPSFT